jgi:hypothetical protein
MTTALDGIADLNAALRPIGWALLDVTINTTTGFARIIAERRDHREGKGVMVTLMRGAHGSKVVERRDITERKPGMYRDFWTVVDSLGGRTFDGMRSALRGLAHYIDDNPIGEAGGRIANQALRALAGQLAVEGAA